MNKLLLGLLCFPLHAMELKDAEEGHAVGTLSVETTTHLTYSAPDLDNDHISSIIKSYFPSANGNVSKHVCPLLKEKINRSSGNCFDNEDRLRDLMAEAIDEAIGLKDQELSAKDAIISENEVRIARINRNKKIALAVVTGCTAVATCIITATLTLVPAEVSCNQ